MSIEEHALLYFYLSVWAFNIKAYVEILKTIQVYPNYSSVYVAHTTMTVVVNKKNVIELR